MNPRHTVDVVMAPRTNETPADAVPVTPEPEHADVTPDSRSRIILLAPTKRAGHEYAEVNSIDPVAIVTPRSPEAARGTVADSIHEVDGLDATVAAQLRTHAAPALAAG